MERRQPGATLRRGALGILQLSGNGRNSSGLSSLLGSGESREVLGTDLPALGCLLPGKCPKSKGQQQDFYPHKRGESHGALPRTRRGALTLSKRCGAGWKAPHHHILEQALTPTAGIQVIQDQHPPLEVTDSTGPGARCSSSFSAAQPQPQGPSSAGPETELSPRCPLRCAEGETAQPPRRTSKARGVLKPCSVLSHLTSGHRVFSAQESPWGALALSKELLKDS